jgi:hypothetical protein
VDSPEREQDNSFEKEVTDINTTATSGDSQTIHESPAGAKKNSDPCILEHGLSLDISPSLIYASGDAVVADYLEFKSLKGLYCSLSRPQNKAKPSSTELELDTLFDASATILSFPRVYVPL